MVAVLSYCILRVQNTRVIEMNLCLLLSPFHYEEFLKDKVLRVESQDNCRRPFAGDCPQ